MYLNTNTYFNIVGNFYSIIKVADKFNNLREFIELPR